MKKLLLVILFFFVLNIGVSYAAILITNQDATYSGPSTTISFRLNTYGFVTVYVRDSATDGIIKTMNYGYSTAGLNRIIWDGTKDSGGSATTGNYYVNINAAGIVITGYTPIKPAPIIFTGGAGLAFNKNTADTQNFGRLYATDAGAGKKNISIYYPDLTLIRSSTAGQSWGLYGPFGIDIDKKSLVWVSDRSNLRVILLAPDLNYSVKTVTGTGLTRMDICVTGDTTAGALYMVYGDNTISRIEKSLVTNGNFSPFQFIAPISPSTTTLRGVIATQDNANVYTAQIEPTPVVKQFTGSGYSYTQTGWTTAVDSAFAFDFTPDGLYLWIATWDTTANLKKVRISDGVVVDSFVADTTYAGCIAVDPAGNIAGFYGNYDETGKPRMNIWQPPDSGSNWVANTNPFHFTTLGNIIPSINSTSANPSTIPSDGATASLLTAYISDPDGYTDDTSVYLDATSLGGSATQPFTLVSGSTTFAYYTTYVTAAPGSAVGIHPLPVYVLDSGGNIVSGNGNLYVTAGFIAGRVLVTGTAVGIPDATVTATGGTGPYTALTGPTGNYVMDAAVGSYTVSADKLGWDVGTNQTGVNVILGSTTGNIDVTLTPKSIAAAKALPLPVTVAMSGITLAPRGKYLPLPYGLNDQYYLADEGSPDAVKIVDTDITIYPRMGQKVVVEGQLELIAGMNEKRLVPTFSAIIGTGSVVAPMPINITDIATTNFGKFVTLSNVTVGSVIPQAYYSRYTVSNIAGRALVYYDNNSTLNDTMVPLPVSGAPVTVTGIISQLAPSIYTPVIRVWYIGRIDVSPSSATLIPGQTRSFTASSGTAPYIWSSSDTAIGTIDNTGLFTAVSNGTCGLTVTDANSYFGFAYVSVEGTSAPLVNDQNNFIYRRETIE